MYNCTKCKTLVCYSCMRILDEADVCPRCEETCDHFPVQVILVIALSFTIALSAWTFVHWGVSDIERAFEWDTMEVVPFEEGVRGERVKVFGRIEGDRDVVLFYNESEIKSKRWDVTDFNLTYRNETIPVFISYYKSIIPKDWDRSANGSYENGDLVYVVGIIEKRNGVRTLRAERVVYDEGVYEETFQQYRAAAWVVGVGLISVMTFMLHPWQWKLVRRWRAGRSTPHIDNSQLPDRIESYRFARSWARTIVGGIFFVTTPFFIAIASANVFVFLAVTGFIDYTITESVTERTFLVGIPIAFTFAMTGVLFFDSRTLHSIDITEEGVIYQYPKCDIERIPWEEIVDVEGTNRLIITSRARGILCLTFGFESKGRRIKAEMSHYIPISDWEKAKEKELQNKKDNEEPAAGDQAHMGEEEEADGRDEGGTEGRDEEAEGRDKEGTKERDEEGTEGRDEEGTEGEDRSREQEERGEASKEEAEDEKEGNGKHRVEEMNEGSGTEGEGE